jgi:Cellulase (glycosyl hydrolase family 5)
MSLRRALRLLLALSALAAVAAPAGLAAERMWVGFHDDPSFRWVSDRESRIRSAATEGATVIRLLVHWNQTAPRRPARASDPFDPAYNFRDLDDAIRTAQESDLEVLLTLYGTPRWANRGRGPNVMPQRVSDFTAFARAIATRYSGRFDGYPFVRFWTVWNEPNLQLFLAPQFDRRGRSVAPRNYAKLYAAAYKGIKVGNRRALVGMGETSARGTDNPDGARPIHSPGRFAELLARANPRLKFDAYSHHPYPFRPNLKPSQKVRWPNVTLASLPVLEANLKKWFKRKTVPIWVTEYGHQTRPQDEFGVSYATQAAYIRQAIAIARKQPFVTMFIWFVYQDDPGQPWESGIYTRAGTPKGRSPSRFSAAARPLDGRNPVLALRRGTVTPLVTLYTRRFCVGDTTGTAIGVTWRVWLRGRLIGVGQQSSSLLANCTITVRLRGFTVARNTPYVATFELNDINGVELTRRLTLRGV